MAGRRILTSAIALCVVNGSFAQTWHLGNGFTVCRTPASLAVTGPEGNILTTDPTAFISASAGHDIVTGSNGAFQFQQVDVGTCQGQTISSIEPVTNADAISQSALRIAGSLLNCGNATAPYTVHLWVPASSGDRVAFKIDVGLLSDTTNSLQKLYFSFDSTPDEEPYGLGGQASYTSLKNQTVPVFSREQGVGRGDEPITSIENQNNSFAGGNEFTTYTAIPSYITTQGRVVYLTEESTAYATFNFSKLDRTTIRYHSTSVRGHIALCKDDMFGAVEKLTAYTGRMPALPKWVDSGAILGIQGGQDKVKNIVDDGLDKYDCPVAAIWTQDWCGTHSQAGPYINISRLWWNWEYDIELYPQWPEFVQSLRDERNVRSLSYINVFLANVSTKASGYRRNLYNEATDLRYFVENATTNGTAVISSGPGLEAGIIDLTNPTLRSWLADVMRKQVWNASISGFMSDFGEYTPVTPDTRIYDGQDAFFFHNQYPFLWAKFQRDLVDSLGLQDEAVVFHRSAAMGANRYMNLFWVGDQNVDWGINDGLKSVVTSMVSMGFSGYSQQHSDVGGYTTVLTYQDYNITRSPELLGRWGELAAVSSAVFRSHEGNIPSVNAQFYSNSSTYTYYAYNARMFASLAPYRRKILQTECETKGWPLLRAPVMYHLDDAEARNITYQSFYLGPALYVAPVMDPGVSEVEVYLPGKGTFTHVWSGKTYLGGQKVTVAAPYGKPAVFVVNQGLPELGSFLEFVKKENETVLEV